VTDKLGEPAVPAAEYDRRYFLESCMGADEWRESGGERIAGIYPGMLARAGFEPGMRLLDVGAGRGELVRAAVEAGAAEAIGIDYSGDAVEMSRQTLAASGMGDRARVLTGDARKLEFDDAGFDLVTMVDVVEHLAPDELRQALAEAHRVLRPGGRVFAHTAPNRLVYDVTYRLQRLWWPPRLRAWPAEPRNDYELRMHINEQRLGTLRRALRASGFRQVRSELGVWVHVKFVPEQRAERLYRRLARLPGLRRFGVIELYAHGIKP
jgi:ubiquinone/menaquinone biosynthesis C-methylase UbiE